MPKSVAKIALSSSRDIPFNRLVLSQANVRRIKAGVSIEELAEDIARRTLLQSLTVRPILDDKGAETGMFEVPAGGRRFRALELLVKQKRLARTAPIPCVVRTEGLAEEDSLAENIQRAPLHPLDQFRAFFTLREKGKSEEEIAAAFFVSPGRQAGQGHTRIACSGAPRSHQVRRSAQPKNLSKHRARKAHRADARTVHGDGPCIRNGPQRTMNSSDRSEEPVRKILGMRLEKAPRGEGTPTFP